MSLMKTLMNSDEVAWLPLIDVCDLITTGKVNAHHMEEDGIYPFFTCHKKPYKINNYAFDFEAILISGNGSQTGHLNYYNGKFNAYQRTYVVGKFKKNILAMYLYHYLSGNLRKYINKHSKKGAVPYITMPMLANFSIPIPCPNNINKSMDIQNEIVRILDTFTELATELATELRLRQKQYMYYRDNLLKFNKEGVRPHLLDKLLGDVDVEYLPLGEIASIKTGGSVSKQKIADNPGDYPVINSGRKPLGFINEWNTENEPLGVTTRGSVGSITWQEGKYFRGNLNYSISIKKQFNVKDRYLYHLLLFLQRDILNVCTFDAIPALNANNLKRILIPIPCPDNAKKSLNIQSNIVNNLDKFDMLINSISDGLPREIELRHKQYEYYRDLLFDFPKPKADVA